MMRRLVLCMLALALLLPGGTAWAQEVKLGSLNDLTGPTSDVGKDIALGIREAVQYVNDTGGVNGKKIRLFLYDYGYRVPEAITTYKRFRDFDRVAGVLGWGTGDTEALSPTVGKDRMPYLSHSFAAKLTDPKTAPYNFVYGTDYSSNARAALTAWFEEVWMKDPRFREARAKGEKPRIVMFYAFPVPYSSAPIKALKNHAELLGFEIGPDQDVSLTALDTKSQVLTAKAFKPHVAWHGNTTMSVAATIKDAHALGLGAGHLVNNWGYDENLIRLAGPAAEGVMGIAVVAFYGEKVPLMDKVLEYGKKVNPGVPPEARMIRTVQSWAQVLMMAEALKRADRAGKLTGPGLREAFETFRGWTPGLGLPPVTLTATDHRPGSAIPIYRIKGGKFEVVKPVDLKAKWPKQWEGEWFGY
ncbi:MAG: ABC transporter substrate-binding protein [Candidatus Rokubacteria bacterium]|nr:ABC transporter substrate-binding protein [Candidatus Rokubacteria bacterium]